MNIHILLILITKYFFSGLGFRYIQALRYEDSWSQLIVKGVCCLVFAFISKIIFNIVTTEKSEDQLAEEAYENEKKKKN